MWYYVYIYIYTMILYSIYICVCMFLFCIYLCVCVIYTSWNKPMLYFTLEGNDLTITRRNHWFTQQKLSVWEETGVVPLCSSSTNSHGDFKPQDGHLLRPRMEVPHLTTMQMSTLIGVDQHTLRLHQQKEMVLKFHNQTCWFHLISSTQLKIIDLSIVLTSRGGM